MSAVDRSVAHSLHALQGAHVLVIGDVMLDRYVYGDVERISPEAPVPVLREKATRLVLGGAANVAANVASVGARVTLVGRVGTDAAGVELAALLERAGIAPELVADAATPTTTKTRFVAGSQQLARVDHEDVHPTGVSTIKAVLTSLESFLGKDVPRAVVLADYAKGLLGTALIRAVIAAATNRDVPVVTDPKGTDLSRYAGSTVIKPNLAEARAACPSAVDAHMDVANEIRALADACLVASGARNVVLSCSADGVAVLGPDGPGFAQLPTRARDVADVSGAGDTLVALTALGLAAELPLLEAVEIANAAAGVVCGKAGTATLTGTELLSVLVSGVGTDLHEAHRKILTGSDEAHDIGEQYQLDGRRLVFANGCFDLLHAGHIRLLAHARSLGDALMVALNSDASVRKLKGEGRPIQSEQDRCEIMAALACVDYVVLFSEDTPLDLVKAVRPAVLVKGDDYRSDEVVGGTETESWGGEVVLVPRLEGRSTTSIISSGSHSR
ncbi:MAG: D-glycero-beta-D-manno-heptose 1-phosphate adenylyltransferase [Acidimicrobiales bacterium]